ncbi:hypothetical protein ABTM45_19365, partial [Acinetobacter baumannii]
EEKPQISVIRRCAQDDKAASSACRRSKFVIPRRDRRARVTGPELAAEALGDFLGSYMRRRFGSAQERLVEMVPSIARIALECIGNS